MFQRQQCKIETAKYVKNSRGKEIEIPIVS